METLEKSLQVKTEIGGVARYGNDRFRRVSLETPGNPWFIATLRIARWRIAKATSIEELSSALELLKWTARNALPSGALAEQLDPYTGKPLSATPLLWSHAEYVLSVTEYISKHQEITMAQPIQT
jgi:GH15 family glucan-1,4-alpha-glucosidase